MMKTLKNAAVIAAILIVPALIVWAIFGYVSWDWKNPSEWEAGDRLFSLWLYAGFVCLFSSLNWFK